MVRGRWILFAILLRGGARFSGRILMMDGIMVFYKDCKLGISLVTIIDCI